MALGLNESTFVEDSRYARFIARVEVSVGRKLTEDEIQWDISELHAIGFDLEDVVESLKAKDQGF